MARTALFLKFFINLFHIDIFNLFFFAVPFLDSFFFLTLGNIVFVWFSSLSIIVPAAAYTHQSISRHPEPRLSVRLLPVTLWTVNPHHITGTETRHDISRGLLLILRLLLLACSWLLNAIINFDLIMHFAVFFLSLLRLWTKKVLHTLDDLIGVRIVL
jgi:hypothetical protein